MPEEEEKPKITEPSKSSMEILSELFSTFDAEPPIIVKKEKDESKKRKKSKKKHKHKDKKHKKKEKKRKRSDSSSSEHSAVDLAELLIKQERLSPEKKVKSEDLPKEQTDDVKDTSSKISITNLKFSSIFEATIREVSDKIKVEGHEDGELSDKSVNDTSESHRSKRKRKQKHQEKVKKKKRSEPTSSKEKSKSEKSPKRECKHKAEKHKEYYEEKRKSKDKDRDFKESSRHRDSSDLKFRETSRTHDDYKHSRKENSYYKESDKSEDKWFMRDRYRGYSKADRERDGKFRDHSRSRDSDTHIDKKKLLEIARRNAIQMMKSGSLPAALTLGRHAQEKVLAAIRSGGKTIEELTDFCKTLSNKEELGELSGASGDENESDNDKDFHHPFQIKDRPTGIVMNIKNSTPLPIKSAQERSTELRIQFPVSSGSHHRKTESEWIPVSSKKAETPRVIPEPPPAPVPIPPPPEPVEVPLPPLPPPKVHTLPELPDPSVDIGAIVSQRLTAMRKLQENPYDVEALNEMHKSQREMQTWAESKQQPGQFTGSTGANILTQAELCSGYQAWAKKLIQISGSEDGNSEQIVRWPMDQLQNAAPVSGGMGMHLLKKMGWNPGEGLGKEKTGTLEPLLLEVKLDKKGLLANEEQKKKQQKLTKATVKTLEGKHPVSLLGEFTAKRKLGAPQYQICLESGPDHKKLFLFKVIVNGVEYKPETASPNKKQAKADAAKLCLQHLGLLSVT